MEGDFSFVHDAARVVEPSAEHSVSGASWFFVISSLEIRVSIPTTRIVTVMPLLYRSITQRRKNRLQTSLFCLWRSRAKELRLLCLRISLLVLPTPNQQEDPLPLPLFFMMCNLPHVVRQSLKFSLSHFYPLDVELHRTAQCTIR